MTYGLSGVCCSILRRLVPYSNNQSLLSKAHLWFRLKSTYFLQLQANFQPNSPILKEKLTHTGDRYPYCQRAMYSPLRWISNQPNLTEAATKASTFCSFVWGSVPSEIVNWLIDGREQQEMARLLPCRFRPFGIPFVIRIVDMTLQ